MEKKHYQNHNIKNVKIFLLFIVMLLVFSSFFNFISPNNTYAATPAEEACRLVNKNYRQNCIDGYNKGLTGKGASEETLNKVCANGKDRNSLKGAAYEKANACSTGYQMGLEAAEKKKREARLKKVCEHYKNLANAACADGYREGYTAGTTGSNPDINETCKKINADNSYRPPRLTASPPCEHGFQAGKSDAKLEDVEREPNGQKKLSTAEKACQGVDVEKASQRKEFCVPGYLAGKAGQSQQEACGNGSPNSDSNVRACVEGWKLATASKAGQEPEDNLGCSSELSLGWAICAVVAAVGEFTDYVFSNIIQPMMEESPLSSESSDPFYKSWQSFRFIGNILLIGSMLAIVYSMARGDE